MSIFEGSATAIVTPFKNGNIDYEAYENLLNFQLENDTDAIVVCGTTGESSTLSHEEKIKMIEFTVKKVNHKIPVIAGTGGNDTQKVIELSKVAENLGVDALLIVTPYYNKATQNGLYNHYKVIAENVMLPIILYNVPSRTGVNIKPETVKRLSEIENIVAIKEASGDISQVAEIASICNIDIYSGNDDQIVPILSLGGKGVISVLSNVLPKETHDIVHNYLNGNINEATAKQLKYLKLIKLLFSEVNPIPVKAALSHMNLIKNELRMPLSQMEDDNFEKLVIEMKKLNIAK